MRVRTEDCCSDSRTEMSANESAFSATKLSQMPSGGVSALGSAGATPAPSAAVVDDSSAGEVGGRPV